ncbi:MAG: hypothetical protein ACK40S_13135 [Burkholderiaceae bacterium]
MHHLVRASDPITSVIAAEGSRAFSGPHCDRILAALQLGPATAHELQATTGLTVVQIDRRLPELRRAGKARVSQHMGEDLVRNGARVWEACAPSQARQ